MPDRSYGALAIGPTFCPHTLSVGCATAVGRSDPAPTPAALLLRMLLSPMPFGPCAPLYPRGLVSFGERCP
jgi:hypothetical protein